MRVEVTLLGRFAVSIDGDPLPAEAWNRRHAAALVKLLALAPRGRLHRDQVTDALWPDAGTEAALPRLHKAAHYARQALGSRDAVVLQNEIVALFPGATLEVDAFAFEAAADTALRQSGGFELAIGLYSGALIPDDLYEAWLEEPRLRLHTKYERLLRAAEAIAATHRPADRAARPPAKTPGPDLLEREDELGVLSRAARSVVRTGHGIVVLVTGEAGSGKSALTRAFLHHLDEDMTVAVGGCDDLLAPRSLGPFRDIAETLPDLASVLSRTTQPEDVLPAVLRLLGKAPTVLVLEDVHWADDATLDAIRYLSRRISAVPAVLLLTFREEDIDATHPLRRILGSLSGASTRRIELAALSVQAVRRLAGGDEREAAEIHRITKGNPFFVTEVLDAAGQGVPATVRDAVLARVGRLPAAARRLAERIAVVPSRTERWLAEALAAGEPTALVHIERSGVVGGSTEYVSFRHELARQAIETSLTVGELVQANREVLEILLHRDHVEPSRIVHHAVPALRTDLLLQYGPVAAADAERDGAHRQAAETLRAVLAYAAELDPAEHADLLTRRAYSLYVVNEYQEALPCAEAAVAVAQRSPDPVVLAEALMVLSRIVFFAQGPMTARRAAARAVELLEKQGDEARLAAALIELARTHSNLATVGIVAQPDAGAVRHADRALALAERLRRDDLRAQALWYRGGGRLALGDPAGHDDIERAIGFAASESRLETRVRSYVNAAGSAYRSGRPHDAQEYVATGLRLAADGEFAAGDYRLHLTSAAVAGSQGDWDQAIAEARDLVNGPGEPGMMDLLARGLLARLLARRGDPEAREILDAAMRDPLWTGDSYIAGPLAVARVELAWLTGTAGDLPAEVWSVLDLATASQHTAIQAELCGYLRRAGYQVDAPADAPGPWGPALAGRSDEAAQAWLALGERYEYAVELARSADDHQARAGSAVLAEIGATATLARLRAEKEA